MKRLACAACGAPMTNDEIAFCLHLHGGAAARFLCVKCMAADFGCPPEHLQKKNRAFKKQRLQIFC